MPHETNEKDPVASERAGQAGRDASGRFVAAEPNLPDIDTDDDPLTNAMTAEMAEAAGFAAGEEDEEEQAAGEGEEEEEQASGAAGGDEEESSPGEVDPLLEQVGALALEAREQDDEDEEVVLERLERRNPALAKKVRAAMRTDGDQDLDKELEQALKKAGGPDIRAVADIMDRRVKAALRPHQEQQESERRLREWAAKRRQEFAAFTAKNPGWHRHRPAMLEALRKMAKNPEIGPERASRFPLADLLEMVAPDFKPTSSRKAVAKDAAERARSKTAGKTAPPPSRGGTPQAGGGKPKQTAEQRGVDRTVRLIQYHRAVANPF